MKNLFLGILVIIVFSTCKKSSSRFYNLQSNFYGKWEITKYELNGENLISKSNFTRNSLIVRENSYSQYSYGGSSGGYYCNDTILLFDIDLNLDDSKITFEKNGHCSHPDAIDPLYFYIGTELQNSWRLKTFNKTVMIITNSKTENEGKIKILFEKLKD